MGFLKKIFKPVSKVLDKVIPNELKPALPYLAAFAPMFGPTSALMGQGIMQRALISGGLNIAGQLSQEGNEGDINLLSAGLGALSGAMTAPGTPGTPDRFIGPAEKGFMIEGTPATTGFQDFAAKGINRYGADSAMGEILTGASKASKFMTDPGLSKYAIPVAQGTGDLAFAQAKRDQDEYDRMMEEESEADAASDAQRAFAIRRAMEATGATEEEIEDAIYAAGYKTGGRVGLRFGGIGKAVENIEDTEMKEAAKFAMQDMDIPIMDLVEEFEIQFKRKPNSMEELKQFYKDRYEYKGPGDVKMKEEIKEKVVMEAKDGGRIGLQEGGVLAQILPQASQITTLSQRPLLAGLQPLRQAEAVFPRLNQLEQGVGRAEETLGRIRSRLGPEQKAQIAGFQPMLQPALGYQPLNMLNLNRGIGISALQSGPEAQGMKDGGLMNLGGKEMDLRKGGFVPIGKKERADDVPARLSKNEFVMTADAVRAAGGGSVNEGAKRMYKVMNDLEARA